MKDRTKSVAFCALLAACLLLPGTASAAKVVSDTDTYCLGTCPVSGGKLGSMGDAVVKEAGDREVRFCCGGCAPKYEAKLEESSKKVDAEVVAQQQASYPLDTCLVSGGQLGGMGEPVDYVYGNRLVRFCCAGCIDTFKKAPGKYIAKLDAAVIAQQGPSYPLDTCPVMKSELGGDKAVDLVIANRLVRLCCGGCVDEVKKDPAKYFKAIDAAKK